MNVYDFDNTIYDGDSSVDLYFFCLRRFPYVLTALPAQGYGGLKYLLRDRRGDNGAAKTVFKEYVYRYFRSVPDLEYVAAEFWESALSKIRPWYLAQQREDDVIISASPEFLLLPACRELGIGELMASRVDPETGRYTGLNCHDTEKVARFRQRFGDAMPDAFYSDSLSDAPMAAISRTAFLVKGERISPWPKNN